jgi:multiple sugar transport system permease protein
MADSILPSRKAVPLESGKPRRRFWSADNPFFWLAPAVVFLALYSIFPLIFNLATSFHEFSNSRREWVFLGGRNWVELFTDDPRFLNALGVTFQYVLFALVIQLFLGLLIALLLDAKPWGSGLMQTLIILPMVTAPAVAGLIFRLLQHSEFGVLSYIGYSTGLLSREEPLLGGTGQFALVAVLLVDIWQWTPFFVLIILAGLKGIPVEVLEAAEVDGAGWASRLFQIKIPLLFGVITVAILFRLVDLFKVFDYIAIMTAGGPALRTESVSYYSFVNTFAQIKWGYGATIGVVIMAIGWFSAWLYQKIFRLKW